jgi:hypothetical protein
MEFPELKNWQEVTISDSEILGDHFATTTPDPIPAAVNPSAQNEPPPPGQEPQGTPLNVGQNIPAPWLIASVDSVLAPVGAFIAQKMGYDVDKKQVALTASERETLKIPVQEWLNTLNITLTPLDKMLITVVMVYAGKITEIAKGPKAPKKKKGEASLNEVAEGAQKKETRGRPKKAS